MASATPPPSSPSHPLSLEDTLSPPLPPEVMCAEFCPGQPNACFSRASTGAEDEALETRTDANALRLENENLVSMKRKLEEQVKRLVQEIASLEAKYEELRGIAQR